MTKPSVQAPSEFERLELCGDCCIEGLTAHYEQLHGVLTGKASVELDLSGIARIDTAGLQLLLAFVLDMKRQGRSVSVAAASEVVTKGAKASGVVELLGL